jgi:hypothetical protein
VNVLDTSTALAGRHQRVLFRGLIDPTEPTERQFLIHPVNCILHLFIDLILSLLTPAPVSHLTLFSGVHSGNDLFIYTSCATQKALTDNNWTVKLLLRGTIILVS